MSLKYVKHSMSNPICVQSNSSLRKLLCALVVFTCLLLMLYSLVLSKQVKLPSLVTRLVSSDNDLGIICSRMGNGAVASLVEESDLQMRLDKCAQYIRLLMMENNQARRAFEKVDIGINRKPRNYENDNLHLQNGVSHEIKSGSKQDKQSHRINDCRQHNCFDYSRCSLTLPFSVYFYEENEVKLSRELIDPFVFTSVTNVVATNHYVTSEVNAACVFLVLVGGSSDHRLNSSSAMGMNLPKMPSWKGMGQNHVLLNLARNVSSSTFLQTVNSARAIVVQSSFDRSNFRPGFDIVAPMLLGKEASFDWKEIPLQIPAKRKYLLSFQGVLSPHTAKASNNINEKFDKSYSNLETEIRCENQIQKELSKLKSLQGSKFYIELNCPPLDSNPEGVRFTEWWICNNKQRIEILKLSTFVLIVAPADPIVSSTMLQMRLYEALKHGAVPVILGERVQLPFSEYIAWEKAAVVLPKARVAEMSSYLSSIHEGDILSLRRRGRFVWTAYLSSTKAVMDGILATLRTRLLIPPRIAPKVPSPTIERTDVKPKTNQTEKVAVNSGHSSLVQKHPQYLHNFTYLNVARELSWNYFPGPFYLYPSTPADPIIPSDAYFMEFQHTFELFWKGSRRIVGKTFRESLGGNAPTEQFTIVILTYSRLPQLISLLGKLKGLPYLNKVLVVWNSPKPPSSDIVWPEMPFKIIKAVKNSLNNRFLPYDEIETEAILSLDDDIQLNHDEIIFAFRVWRENRDRIVGFPGRYHSWDENTNRGFLYKANRSCQLSMVLTGAAFIHTYYAYLYSYVMPKVIRDKVNQHMNCEDIAMNFLVSHVTRKPPIKVNAHTDFTCQTCDKMLSQKHSHYLERHKCIQFFTKVYGYTPLLYTQYRADSVLYRSKHKSSCYEYV